MKNIKSIKGQCGNIDIFEYSKKYLIAKPKGYISRSMIRKDFETIESFDSKGFEYFVDLTDFVIPNPINLIYLRKLKSLEHLKNIIL